MSLSLSRPSPLSAASHLPKPNPNPHRRNHHLSFLPKPSDSFLSGHHYRRLLSFSAAAKPKDLILGNPSVTVEKGNYSYDVETLINKLSSLPPRGSIARCLDIFKNKLSLNDFALVFKA